MCALAGAVTIAIQLPALHWFYYYILWFLPFALVAMLVPETLKSGAPAAEARAHADVRVEDRRTGPIPELVEA
jgi:hypothetical protein